MGQRGRRLPQSCTYPCRAHVYSPEELFAWPLRIQSFIWCMPCLTSPRAVWPTRQCSTARALRPPHHCYLHSFPCVYNRSWTPTPVKLPWRRPPATCGAACVSTRQTGPRRPGRGLGSSFCRCCCRNGASIRGPAAQWVVVLVLAWKMSGCNGSGAHRKQLPHVNYPVPLRVRRDCK